MSNPLSTVAPPVALPSFVTQPVPVSVAAPPPHPAAGALPPPPTLGQPVPVPPAPTPAAPPPTLGQPAPRPPAPAPGAPPPPAGAAAGAVPPPPMGAACGPLSAASAGHPSRPKYVRPPDLATTGSAGPTPMYQNPAVPGAPPSEAAVISSSEVSLLAGGGATVDYAQTPTVYQTEPCAASGAQPQEGWLGWIKDTVQKSEMLSKVAERARTSMDSMITTLDPQMRDLIYSGGDLDLVVASDKEVKVSAVREAFQVVFGKATVIGVPVPGPGLVPQPVGWPGARAAAAARLQSLRSSGLVPSQQAVVVVEGFLAQLEPDRWYDMSLLVLDEPGGSVLSVATQPTEVPSDWVQRMEAATAPDHPRRSHGLQLTVGQVAEATLQVAPSAWHEVMCGLSRRELILSAARVLAHQYRTRRGS